jgi:hypothetical protein
VIETRHACFTIVLLLIHPRRLTPLRRNSQSSRDSSMAEICKFLLSDSTQVTHRQSQADFGFTLLSPFISCASGIRRPDAS